MRREIRKALGWKRSCLDHRCSAVHAFVAVLACFLVYISAAFALDPRKAPRQYVHDVWQIEQGLPQNSIFAIVQTRDGYLWLGTVEGLVRFDGVSFRVFNHTNTPQIRTNWVWDLLEDRDGSLWIGTRGGGLSRLNDGTFRSYTTKDGLAGEDVRCLHQDLEGGIWIGTDDGGLGRYKDGTFTKYSTLDGLSSNRVRAISTDSGGSLWIGTYGGGLNRWKDGKFEHFTTREGLSNDIVVAVYEDRKKDLWVGTKGGGLNLLKDGKVTVFTKKDGLSPDYISSMYEDREGNLWIGTYGSGLYRRTNEEFTNFDKSDGLSDSMVPSLYEDREGSIWIGTLAGGLNRLRDGKFTTFTTHEGLNNNDVWAIHEGRDGSLWIGTYGGGLNRWENGKFTAYSAGDGLSSYMVVSLHEDREGSLWVGTYGGGVNRMRNGRITVYNSRNGLSSNDTQAVYEDREGSMWVGTNGGGLNRIKDGKITIFNAKDGLVNNSVRCFNEDREGSLWIGTDGGINRYRDGKFLSFTTRDGLSSDYVWSIYTDPDGTLWIGTNGGGLNRWKDGKFTAFTTRVGLYDDVVFALLEDVAGNLWMSCNKGVFRVSKNELNDFADGRIASVQSIAYGTMDGMKTRECNGGAQSAGLKTRDGRLFFPTIKGLATIDPQNILENHLAPPVAMEKVVVDGRLIYESPARFRYLSLAPGAEKFEFHYTALSLTSPGKVLFQYRLEGFDRDWVDAGIRRAAYYTNIPPGNYTFRVKACNNDGVWNELGVAFPFGLKPYFYQTWWFYAVCVLAVFGVGAGAHRVRVGRLKARERELAVLVEEKTRDLRESNKKIEEAHQRLVEAEEKLTRFGESSSRARENFSEWCGLAVAELKQILSAGDMAVWLLEKGEAHSIVPTTLRLPAPEQITLLSSSSVQMVGDQVWVPVRGMAGELSGILAVKGLPAGLEEVERRLLTGFARQFGGALEMERMRVQVKSLAEQRAVARKQMQEKGVATLQICPDCKTCYDHHPKTCAVDGAGLETPHILPCLIAGRYRLARLLGEGGMGWVFSAQDETLQRATAVKIIRAELLGDPLMRSRLQREAHTVARIRHPGVVAVYDFGEIQDGSAYLVMELLLGTDLRRLLEKQGPGTPQQVAAVLQQVGEALSTTHAHGIIHRDLKPANLFLLPTPLGFQMKIVDFGLAKSIEEAGHLTRTGTLVGTPGYMSPEQIRGQSLDARSDLFSIASVAYELLTGVPLFSGESLPDVILSVLMDDPPALSMKLPDTPPELEPLFFRALIKDPKLRPADVNAWLSDVLSHLKRMSTPFQGWRLESILS